VDMVKNEKKLAGWIKFQVKKCWQRWKKIDRCHPAETSLDWTYLKHRSLQKDEKRENLKQEKGGCRYYICWLCGTEVRS